jgi:hypothetical protein
MFKARISYLKETDNKWVVYEENNDTQFGIHIKQNLQLTITNQYKI